jgi:hypothetical protein
MISERVVKRVDEILDEKVAQEYKDQPLAQDWARVCKEHEEHGEAIAELILATGQNPRKPRDPEAMDRLCRELADRAMTGVYAIQHFTKNVSETSRYMIEAQVKHESRLT